jgi:hypothetical protein
MRPKIDSDIFSAEKRKIGTKFAEEEDDADFHFFAVAIFSPTFLSRYN